MVPEVKDALRVLPDGLRADLITAYEEIVSRYARRDWEPSELSGGKLCEAAYTVIVGFLDGGTYADRATKPPNLPGECWNLASRYPRTANHSARVLIPRMIMGLYDIRNNRGVGHAGGDVDPNEMDATAVLAASKWILAEILRLLHNLSLSEAQVLVDSIVERHVPIVWVSGSRRRVLRPGLSLQQKVLILLLSAHSATDVELSSWIDHGNIGNFRQTLRRMHGAALIDFDDSSHRVVLLPPGMVAAESIVRSDMDASL